MKENKQYGHLGHFIIFLLAVYLFFKIIQPVMTIILTSIIITYVSYPLYRRIKKRIEYDFWSIILTMSIIFVVLMIPFSYLAIEITQQTFEFSKSLSVNLETGSLTGITCKNEASRMCSIINNLDKFSAEKLSKFGFGRYLEKILSWLLKNVTDYLIKIPQAILGTGIAVFLSYFLFRDGEKIISKIKDWLPFRKKNIERFMQQFERVTHSIIFAQLFVAMAQGAVGILGFYLFGIPLPIFWGVVLAFFALVPAVGTAIIWIPASLYLVLGGYLSQDYILMYKGIGLFVYGVLLISTIDNILRIKIIDKKANVHPIIVIVGVVGGVNMFGAIGLFLGPIILSMLLIYFENFKERFM